MVFGVRVFRKIKSINGLGNKVDRFFFNHRGLGLLGLGGLRLLFGLIGDWGGGSKHKFGGGIFGGLLLRGYEFIDARLLLCFDLFE